MSMRNAPLPETGGKAARKPWRVGALTDQKYAFVSAALGYWLYRSDDLGVALQGELHWNRSFGSRASIHSGPVSVDVAGPR